MSDDQDPKAAPSVNSTRVSSGPRCRIVASASVNAATVSGSGGPAFGRLLTKTLRPHMMFAPVGTAICVAES